MSILFFCLFTYSEIVKHKENKFLFLDNFSKRVKFNFNIIVQSLQRRSSEHQQRVGKPERFSQHYIPAVV